VVQTKACLVDAYDTILTCDFSIERGEMSAMAGLSADAWAAGYHRIAHWLDDGRISKAEGFAEILRACGKDPRPELIRQMVDRDQELLLAHARLYDDSVPFLEKIRDRGIKVAIVSNCTESTRPLLVKLGVTALADAVILSCEVRSAKPAAEIFWCALDRLGVSADAAVFVDDQARYCAGAVAMGISAAQIVRGELDGQAPAAGATVIRSLADVEALLAG
jgi:putative hydrolase of the HAD superfamily